MSDRPCTCHPDDNPPVPCPQKYALSECRDAAPPAVQQAETVAFPGGPRMGSALQKLGARLADMLDDDQWNNIEPMLLDVHAEAAPPADDEAVRLLEGCGVLLKAITMGRAGETYPRAQTHSGSMIDVTQTLAAIERYLAKRK